VIGVVGMVGVVVLLLFGCEVLAILARGMAAHRMDMWAIGAAQQWLARAAWLDPDNGEVELMQAACCRRYDQSRCWHKAILSAERMGVPAVRIWAEKELVAMRTGQLSKGPEALLPELIEAGVSPQDVATHYLDYYLVHKQYGKARVFLEGWEKKYANDAHVAYLWGSYWLTLEQFERARTQFEVALARQPRHELARSIIAELFEVQNRLDQALEQRFESVTRSPGSAVAKVGLARVLRRRNCTSQARALLTPLTSSAEPLSAAVLEMAQLELEAGNYREAQRWFARADLETNSEKLVPAAVTSTLLGDLPRAERLLARYEAEVVATQRATDLETRLSINPFDRQAADEYRSLLPQSRSTAKNLDARDTRQTREDGREDPVTSAAELYALECSACHGANGDGEGRAARHLFPRPRDLRTGKFRLVSTFNGVPTLDDLEAVIKLGMPGTSMPSYENLSESERKLLTREVLRLYREGVRGQFIHMLRSQGEEIDEDEVLEVVQLRTTAGEVVRVPQIGPPDSLAIARGRETYLNLGCHHCHGDDGAGAPNMPLFDDKWRRTRPRDLVHEPLKGGQEPESIYLRIFVGMPGTPHPACRHVSNDKVTDLVHYCRSLSREPKLALTNLQRLNLATTRAYLSAFVEFPAQ